MLKKVSILSAIILTGCATQVKPVFSPPPPPCEMMIAGKCKSMTAQEKSGATSLGYKDDEDLPAKASQP
jgi:hypothetical protein